MIEEVKNEMRRGGSGGCKGGLMEEENKGDEL